MIEKFIEQCKLFTSIKKTIALHLANSCNENMIIAISPTKIGKELNIHRTTVHTNVNWFVKYGYLEKYPSNHLINLYKLCIKELPTTEKEKPKTEKTSQLMPKNNILNTSLDFSVIDTYNFSSELKVAVYEFIEARAKIIKKPFVTQKGLVRFLNLVDNLKTDYNVNILIDMAINNRWQELVPKDEALLNPAMASNSQFSKPKYKPKTFFQQEIEDREAYNRESDEFINQLENLDIEALRASIKPKNQTIGN